MLWNCGCCGCDPTTTKICVTVTDHCTSAAVSGATVTAKDSHGVTVGTCTTDASGHCCVGLSQKGTYTVTASKSGYCDSSQSVNVSSCGATFNISPSLFPTTIPWSFAAALACSGSLAQDCPPSATYPVTVTITQTAGGSYTGSCVLDSSASCTKNIPAPCPGTSNYTFSVVWSSPGFTSQTTTITLTNGVIGWKCSGSNKVTLDTPTTDFNFVGSDCLTAIPSTVQVTLTPDPCGTGPYTLNFAGRSLNVCDTGYTGTFTCGITTMTLQALIQSSASDDCSCTGKVIYTIPPGTNVTMNLTSGTACCPIAFSAADGSGNSATVTE